MGLSQHEGTRGPRFSDKGFPTWAVKGCSVPKRIFAAVPRKLGTRCRTHPRPQAHGRDEGRHRAVDRRGTHWAA